MRQVALITLIAQIGCFVPARAASIGVVDRIFTRVGASDDLSTGQSTFMLEMTEVANILRNLTRKSLVILDEIGRGTSTYDGLSIAWAVAEYIAKNEDACAKTLFATHYHEMIALEDEYPHVTNLNVAVLEDKDDIIFLRKIQKGGADRSYGIQVAKLAGVPEPVIERAKQILGKISVKENLPEISSIIDNEKNHQIRETDISKEDHFPKMSFDEFAVMDKLKNADLDSLSPLEALNFLYELKNNLGG